MTVIEHSEGRSRAPHFPCRVRDVFQYVLLLAGCSATILVFPLDLATLASVWLCLTLVIVRSDLDRLIIPDWATASVALLGLLHSLALAKPAFASSALVVSLERAMVTFFCVALFGWAFKFLTGRDGLGFGDVKLCAALALWLEPSDFLIMIELASFAALSLIAISQLRHKDRFEGGVIPFGAFLAPSGWLVFMWEGVGNALKPWHLFLG